MLAGSGRSGIVFYDFEDPVERRPIFIMLNKNRRSVHVFRFEIVSNFSQVEIVWEFQPIVIVQPKTNPAAFSQDETI